MQTSKSRVKKELRKFYVKHPINL